MSELIIVHPNKCYEIILKDLDFSKVSFFDITNQLIYDRILDVPSISYDGISCGYYCYVDVVGNKIYDFFNLQKAYFEPIKALQVQTGSKLKCIVCSNGSYFPKNVPINELVLSTLNLRHPVSNKVLVLPPLDFRYISFKFLISSLIDNGTLLPPPSGMYYAVTDDRGSEFQQDVPLYATLPIPDNIISVSLEKESSITVILPATNEVIPLSEVNLSLVTNTELIDEFINAGIIPAPRGDDEGYELIILNNGKSLGIETKTLKELGVNNCDRIKIIKVHFNK